MEYRSPLYSPITTDSPSYRALVAFPIATFSLTVLTDIAYLQTSNLLWLHFSEWLLLAGLVFGIIAALFLAGISVVQRRRPAWLHALRRPGCPPPRSSQQLIHTADGWTAVMPYGLATSIVTVAAMILTGFVGRWRHDHV